MRIEQDTNQKKIPQPWKKWILLLAIIQILTVSQMWQMNQKIWKALVHQSQDVIQLGDCLSDHLRNENRHIEAMNQLLEECNQKLEGHLNQISN
jgi:ferritin-like metal-binding protein YciE